MSEVKWIKMSVTLPTNRKLKQIRRLPSGDTIALMWVFLMCLAGDTNDNGSVYFTKDIPFTDEMLADEFAMDVNTVRLGLDTFKRFGMIDIVDNVIYLSAWEKYQSVDRLAELREYNRLAQQKSRAKRKALQGVNDMSMTSQLGQGTDIDKNKIIDKEKKENIEKEKDVADLFNALCPSYSPVQVLSDDMKADIQVSLKKYGIEKIKAVFEKAEASDFLKGGNGWNATFDWLVKEDNIAKVLNGNYDNKTTKSYDKKEVEAEILKRMQQQSSEKVENDPVLMAEAEALKQELQQKYG